MVSVRVIRPPAPRTQETTVTQTTGAQAAVGPTAAPAPAASVGETAIVNNTYAQPAADTLDTPVVPQARFRVYTINY
jgi:hypothetical protein